MIHILKMVAIGVLYGYALIAFAVGSNAIIDIAARITPAMCK